MSRSTSGPNGARSLRFVVGTALLASGLSCGVVSATGCGPKFVNEGPQPEPPPTPEPTPTAEPAGDGGLDVTPTGEQTPPEPPTTPDGPPPIVSVNPGPMDPKPIPPKPQPKPKVMVNPGPAPVEKPRI